MLEYKGPAVSVPPLAFQSAEYLLPPRSGRRDGLSSPVDRVQVVKERAGLGHPPGMVTEQLDHLVLNLTKPAETARGLVGGWVRPDVVMGGLAACRQAGGPLGAGRGGWKIGAAGPETRSWRDLDLPAAGMDASLNGQYIKSGCAARPPRWSRSTRPDGRSGPR